MLENNVVLKKSKRKKYIILAGSIIVVMIIIIKFVFLLNSDIVMGSSSMEPTLKNGWAYRVNKMAYWFNSPQRGDIIVFHHSDKSIGSMAKRIIGLPGEKVQIKDGKVYINDEQLVENYIDENIDSVSSDATTILGIKDYFVLGDNSKESLDSRYEEFGLIHKKNISGKITGSSLRNIYLHNKNKGSVSE